MIKKISFVVLAVAAFFNPTVQGGETVLVPYSHVWQYMHPMGRNPAINDPNFDSTWWLPMADFAGEYDGPEFGGNDVGDAGNTSSINTGSSAGPFGYADVDNWNGAYTPLLIPAEGGSPITSLGTFLTRPTNGNRKASYYRTTFDNGQQLLRPVIRCMVDDGAVIFLDGVQIARVNMTLPTATSLPTYATFSNADPAAPNQTENTLYTIDLTVAGMQASSGTLRAEVINPLPSLAAGSHTLAVFTANVSASNADMLMALQLTAASGGIDPVATNVERDLNNTPTNPADDTFSFDLTVTKLSGFPGTWQSNTAQLSIGSYGTAYRFAGFPANAPVEIMFRDAVDPSLTALLAVSSPPPPLWIGQINLAGQSGPLLCTPATAPEWLQAGNETVLQNNGGGGLHMLQSVPVAIPPSGAVFSAILELEDNSTTGNFEDDDAVEAVLLLSNGVTTAGEVNLLPGSLDRNGDHLLTGYGGAAYNSNISKDELNPGGRSAEASYSEGIALSGVIPAGTVSAQLIVRAVNNHASETFRLKMARFLAAGTLPDLDRDGTADGEELSAGTDPLNAASRFVSTHSTSGNAITVSFPTVANRSYRIISSTDMMTWVPENAAPIPGNGSPVVFNIPATAQKKFVCVQAGRGVNPWP